MDGQRAIGFEDTPEKYPRAGEWATPNAPASQKAPERADPLIIHFIPNTGGFAPF
jgi:hypothetical protein